MRKIEVKNINGFNNLIIDGRYIYSKRNPYKSLKKFISNYESLINNSDSFLIIYGYGLGLIIEELKNIEKEIFIFDFDDEILQQVKTKKELSNFKGFNNINLF